MKKEGVGIKKFKGGINMYKLIKHIIKGKEKKSKTEKMLKVKFYEHDFSNSGLIKIRKALREISGDPDLDFDTCNLEVPFKGFDYETEKEEKTWEWQEEEKWINNYKHDVLKEE